MRVVDLADEFGTTTADTLELCERAGIRAADGGHDLTEAEVDAVRRLHDLPPTAPPPSDSPPPPPPPGPPPGSPFADGTAAPPPPAGSRSGPGSHTAVFALTASLLGLCIPIVPSVIGIVLGTLARRQARAAGNDRKVSGPATAAQVLGAFVLILWGGYFAWSFFSHRTTATLVDKTEVTVYKTAFEEVKSTDCLVIQQASSVEELWVADCAGPHDAQVIGFTHMGYLPTAGEEDVALEACDAEATRAGVPKGVVVGVLVPSVGARTVDFHDGICIAHHPDRKPYVGRL